MLGFPDGYINRRVSIHYLSRYSRYRCRYYPINRIYVGRGLISTARTWQMDGADDRGIRFSSVLGPTLGGYLVDNIEWRWLFWIFLPLGVVAFIMIWTLFPKVERKPGQSIDYLGSLFLTTSIVPLLLAFSWAGTEYAWGSPQIIGLIALQSYQLLSLSWWR